VRRPLLAVAALMVAASGAFSAPRALSYRNVQVGVRGGAVTASVPAGYVLELLTADLQRPRMLTFAANGDLLIGSAAGHIYRLQPPYSSATSLIRLPRYPHSVALRPGEILIAQIDGLYRAPYTLGQARIAPGEVTLVAGLPGGIGHNSRTVRIGPDGGIYVSLGIAGNCSNHYLDNSYPFSRRRGGVVRLEAGEWRPFGSGLRNPVDFDWHPGTGTMYAANNGPDHLGFGQPPEYFSRITPGSFHGMPWFQFDGEQLQRDRCIAAAPPRPAAEVSRPAALLPSRSAPLGMAFVPVGALHPDLVGDAVVALHGSWARQPRGGPTGDPASRRPPELVLVRFEEGAPVRVDALVGGFQLVDGGRWARPAGAAFGPDGALYFTSDAGTEGLFRVALRR
jgi:glucose/arabinose dehydrogenase